MHRDSDPLLTGCVVYTATGGVSAAQGDLTSSHSSRKEAAKHGLGPGLVCIAHAARAPQLSFLTS